MKVAFLLPALILSISLPVSAALPPIPTDQKNESAELIITGKIEKASIEISGLRGVSIYQVTLFSSVEKIEKGRNLIDADKPVKIFCWRLRKAAKGWAGPSGQSEIPAEGTVFRAWLKEVEAGGWEPLSPNGFELLNGGEEISFQKAEKDHIKKYRYLAIAAGLLSTAVVVLANRGSKKRS